MAHFPNHLRSHRKRLTLSQEEVAFLMGTISGEKICRYERFTRIPNLETAIAYEVIFDVPFSDLFPALYNDIRRDIADRAAALLRKSENDSSEAKVKGQALASIIMSAVNNPNS